MEDLTTQQKAENFRRWLRSIDLNSADTLKIERSIYEALYGSQFLFKWDFSPIAPLAESINIDELVGPSMSSAQKEIHNFGKRLDVVYEALSDLNNTVKADLDSIEKQVLAATEAVNDISFVTQDQDTQYYWISETFNSTTFIDPSSTALVDTDFGQATLSPISLNSIDNFNVSVDRGITKGVPGCNLLVLNLSKALSPDKEPDPEIDGSRSYNLSNVFDGDSSTWFEVERNFVAPKQKLIRLGRAYKSDASGKLLDIKEATKDLDWKAFIQWPGEDSLDTGPDGTGVYIAEFRDISGNLVSGVVSQTSVEDDTKARLSLDIILDSPTQLSAITITPFFRDNREMTVERVSVYVSGVEIPVAINTILNSEKTNSGALEREILRRTGAQSTGLFFSVPTDRLVDRIKLTFSGSPYQALKGLAHQFQEQEVHTKTTSTFLGFKSSKHKVFWQRIPINEKPPGIVSETKHPKLFGSLSPILNILGALQLLQLSTKTISEEKNKQGEMSLVTGAAGAAAGFSTIQSLQAVKSGLDALKIGGSLGKISTGIGGFLGKAVPVVGGILAVSDLIGTLFGKKKVTRIAGTVSGYDIFDGYRSAVGIRDINIQQISYSQQSVLLSTKRSFPGKVKKIGLFVEENIPAHWGESDWLKYEVSVDGQTWYQLPKLSETTLDKALSLPYPTSDVVYRVIFNGNVEDNLHMPAIKHLLLQGLPV